MKAASRPLLLVAQREVRLLRRSRATLGAMALLASAAWLPAILLPLRSGSLGLATFEEVLPLQIALVAVVLPLLALLAGAELIAGEVEDGSLIPILTLPVSRRACFAGKCLGRGALLAIAYVAAFSSVGLCTALARGANGWRAWACMSATGLLLSVITGGVGAALGAGGSGRVRAFGAALVTWVVLVFALDALLLALVVASAPPPPGAVGMRGHDEVKPPGAGATGHDPHAREVEATASPSGSLAGSLLAFNPVSLYRLTALAASPDLGSRLQRALPARAGGGFWATLITGWIAWSIVPLLVGLRRFQRANLA